MTKTLEKMKLRENHAKNTLPSTYQNGKKNVDDWLQSKKKSYMPALLFNLIERAQDYPLLLQTAQEALQQFKLDANTLPSFAPLHPELESVGKHLLFKELKEFMKTDKDLSEEQYRVQIIDERKFVKRKKKVARPLNLSPLRRVESCPKKNSQKENIAPTNK